MNRKTFLFFVSFLIVCVCGGYFCGKIMSQRDSAFYDTLRDTVTISDTIEIKDTILCYKPQPYKVLVCDTVFVSSERDTLLREVKEYRDSTYMAWVSGVDANLDSIEIYGKTRYITTVHREFVRDGDSEPSDGLFLSVGANIHDNILFPSVGFNYAHGRILYGANIGTSYNKKFFLGVNVGYKLK